tara:strand:+ start:1007 stop:1300 length:294 start_codon:yes stop_codon:yes gene_type:complete
MREAVIAVIAMQIGEHLLPHAFLLQAECHHRIGSCQGLIQVTADAQSATVGNRVSILTRRGLGEEVGESLRKQTGRPTEHNICTTGTQCPEIGAGHA